MRFVAYNEEAGSLVLSLLLLARGRRRRFVLNKNRLKDPLSEEAEATRG